MIIYCLVLNIRCHVFQLRGTQIFPMVSLLGISNGWLQNDHLSKKRIWLRLRWILELYRYRNQNLSLSGEIIVKWTKPIPIYCGEGSNMKKVVNYRWIKYNGACRRCKKKSKSLNSSWSTFSAKSIWNDRVFPKMIYLFNCISHSMI